MLIISVVIIASGFFLIINSSKGKHKTWIKDIGIFLLGVGFGFFVYSLYVTSQNILSKEQPSNLQNWGVFIAIISAICTTLISIWQNIEARYANRKGAMPIISSKRDSFSDYEKPAILLSNVGMGPAIVGDIFIFIGKECVEGKDNFERFSNFYKTAKSAGFPRKMGTSIAKGTPIKSDQTYELLVVDKSKVDPICMERCAFFYDSINIKITYSDVYDTVFNKHFYFKSGE